MTFLIFWMLVPQEKAPSYYCTSLFGFIFHSGAHRKTYFLYLPSHSSHSSASSFSFFTQFKK